MSGPILDSVDTQIQQLENLLVKGREAERQEAARRAEEVRRRAEREAAGLGTPSSRLKQGLPIYAPSRPRAITTCR